MTPDASSAMDMDSLPEEPTTVEEFLAWIRSREEAWRADRDSAAEETFQYANGMTTAYYCARRRLQDILEATHA